MCVFERERGGGGEGGRERESESDLHLQRRRARRRARRRHDRRHLMRPASAGPNPADRVRGRAQRADAGEQGEPDRGRSTDALSRLSDVREPDIKPVLVHV